MSSECDLKAQEQHSNQYSGQPTYIPFQVSEASPSYIFLFCTQISFSCCLNLNPTCWDKVYCLLQVLTIASQLLHQLCPLWPCLASESIVDNSPMASPSALLPVTMSGIREHCGQQPYGFSLSSAPCDQVWHQRALWTTVSWLLPQLCFLRPCLASESIRDNSSMASPSSLLPMTMSGIREHYGQQSYGFSLSSAPYDHVWHQRALWTTALWLLPQLCPLWPCLASESIVDWAVLKKKLHQLSSISLPLSLWQGTTYLFVQCTSHFVGLALCGGQCTLDGHQLLP